MPVIRQCSGLFDKQAGRGPPLVPASLRGFYAARPSSHGARFWPPSVV